MKDKGGNAVDAAIAANLCIGVLHNFASGIGGGGVMLYISLSVCVSVACSWVTTALVSEAAFE
jgi:gamma-glutamyltranspeptidase